jgi:hypothetical protein
MDAPLPGFGNAAEGSVVGLSRLAFFARSLANCDFVIFSLPAGNRVSAQAPRESLGTCAASHRQNALPEIATVGWAERRRRFGLTKQVHVEAGS